MIYIKQLQDKLDKYVTEYAVKHKMSYTKALEQKRVQNVLTWYMLREKEKKK